MWIVLWKVKAPVLLLQLRYKERKGHLRDLWFNMLNIFFLLILDFFLVFRYTLNPKLSEILTLFIYAVEHL